MKTVAPTQPTGRPSAVQAVEKHRAGNSGWLRAAVLGANDGLLSTSSLVLGVAAAHGTRTSILTAGVAGLAAGAMAMAAGEYVSVHSQADTEKADLNRERVELAADSVGEHAELAAIYVGRGVDPVLATQVANSLWRMTPSAPTRAMNWVFPTNCAHGQLKLRWPPLPASASGQRCHFL